MGASWRPELQLAYVEGKRLIRNPLLWITGVVAAVWVGTYVDSGDPDQDRYVLSVGYALAVLGFVAIAHTMLAVIRSRSYHTEELLDVLPVGADRRSIGHGLSTLTGGAAAAVVTMAIVAMRGLKPNGQPWDASVKGSPTVPQVDISQLLQGPIAVVVVCAFVVALARWIPGWLIIVPLFVLTVLQIVIFGIWFAVETDNPLTWLWPLAPGVVHDGWTGCGPLDGVCDLQVSGFDQVTAWWHLAYLVALCVWLVTIAVLRHRRDRKTWTVFGAAAAPVVALAITQIMVAKDYVPGVIEFAAHQ